MVSARGETARNRMKKHWIFGLCLWLVVCLNLIPPSGSQLLKVKTYPSSSTEEDVGTSTTIGGPAEWESEIGFTTDSPLMTPKGRNFGSRVRGIDSAPFGTNSVLQKNAGHEDLQTTEKQVYSNAVQTPRPEDQQASTPRSPHWKRRRPAYNGTSYVTSTTLSSILNRLRDGNVGNRTVGMRVVGPSHQQRYQASNNMTKIIVRKRPRPAVINDEVAPEPTVAAPEVEQEETVAPMNTSETPVRPSLIKLRRIKPPRIAVVVDATSATPGVPVASVDSQPQAVSASPVQQFQYNPSVTVGNGVYSYRFNEPPKVVGTKVFKESFGVSHVSYNAEDEEDGVEDLDETTLAPPPEDVTHEHGAVDGSEDEVTSAPDTPELIGVDSHEIPGEDFPFAEPVVPRRSQIRATRTSLLTAGATKVAAAGVAKPAVELQNAILPSEEATLEIHEVMTSPKPKIQQQSISATPALPELGRLPTSANAVVPLPPTPQETKSVVGNNAVMKSEDGAGSAVHPADIPPTEGLPSLSSPAPTEPSVSSKAFASVHFTQESLPEYTTSSYSFSSSTEYSYSHTQSVGNPTLDHQDHHGSDEIDEDFDPPYDRDHGGDNDGKQQELHPSTSLYLDTLKSSTVKPEPKGHNEIIKDSHSSASSADGRVTTTSSPDESSSLSSTEAEEVHGNEIHKEEGHGHNHHHHRPAPGGVTEPSRPRQSSTPTTTTGPPSTKTNAIEVTHPSVPVYIHVLLNKPIVNSCADIDMFKDTIVRIYGTEMNVEQKQVVVSNQDKCKSYYNHTEGVSSAESRTKAPSIKFATTTASVIKSVSTTGRSPSAQQDHPTTTPSTSTIEKPRRRSRRDSEAQAHIQAYEEPADLSSPSPTKSEAKKLKAEAATALYPVFFYLTDKSGSYDRVLTEAFVGFWNKNKEIEGGPQATLQIIEAIRSVEMIAPPEDPNDNSTVIMAIAVSAIAVAGLLVLGVLLLVMRHRQSQSKFAKRCTPVNLDQFSVDNVSIFSSFRRKGRIRASKRSFTNSAFDDPNAPSRPLNAQGLTNILKETQKLEDEFIDLPSANPTLEDMPAGALAKNRYANVIPMPDTRVLLTFQDESPHSDYINANFVRGPNGAAKTYIITQGPLEETIVDFWRMVWEQQVRVVMMLTDFSEAGQVKCAEYYPRSESVDSSQLHGDYQITLEKREINENCITSYLVIKDMERNLRRDVVHLWYHTWPEKGIPANPRMTIDFLSKSRKYTKETTPVVVHCSPGTGRSGTLVACDVIMKEFDQHQNVNIPRTVIKIRQDRAGAVQTKEQYLHIYNVAQAYAARFSPSHANNV